MATFRNGEPKASDHTQCKLIPCPTTSNRANTTLCQTVAMHELRHPLPNIPTTAHY